MRPIALLVAPILVALSVRLCDAQATDAREAVRSAVLDYVEGFYEGDTTPRSLASWVS